MLNRRCDQRSYVARRSSPEEAPTEYGKKNEPRQDCCCQSPYKTNNQVIFGHGDIKDEKKERVRQCHNTAGKIMKGPAYGDFVFYRAGLNNILMYKFPTEDTECPPTEGPIPTSPPPT